MRCIQHFTYEHVRDLCDVGGAVDSFLESSRLGAGAVTPHEVGRVNGYY